MGVTGLWRLVEPAGKPVPVETLENKVLAVDISIWLHQVVKGYQDAKGAPLPNAHLMGLFQRLCKLLYFRIKPVFVFDGGFPDLKKETIAKRQDSKAKYNSESERIKRELAVLLSKKTAVSSLLGTKISPKKVASDTTNNDDIFKLPALPQKEEETESESEEEDSSGSSIDLHTADIESETFKKLSVKEKYELLIELKETRKMNSWGRLHELPKKSDNFSNFQMQRLLKRRKVQECLVETEKEMGQAGMSLNDLESLLNEEGIDTMIDNLPTRRIASNNTTRFLLINNVRQALADMKKKKASESQTESISTQNQIPSTSKMEQVQEEQEDDFQKAIAMSMECNKNEADTSTKVQSKKDELDEDLELAIKMSLECGNDDKNTSACSKTDESWTSFLSDSEKSYSDSEGELEPPDLSSAKAYIMQYSDFTNNAIKEIVTTKNKGIKQKSKTPNVNQIIEELNQNKTIIEDNIDISSDEGCESNKFVSRNNTVESETDVIQSQNQVIKSNFNAPIDITESSIICVDKTQEIINLDTSSEIENEIKTASSETDHNTTNTSQKDSDSSDSEFKEVPDVKDSDSSDSEFEEVPEIVPTASKTVVELTLDVGSSLPEDDIFADVFEDKAASLPKDKDIDVINLIENNSNASTTLDANKIDNSDSSKVVLQNVAITKESDLNLKTPSTVTTLTNDSSIVPEKNAPSLVEKPSTQTNGYLIATENNVPVPVSVAQLNDKEPLKSPEIAAPKQKLTAEQLNTMVEDMQNEEQDLIQEKGRLDRIGRNITEQMTKEAQELLRVFGIPYIVAPMEAEAQCAFLETVNLTDGTITDDSDIWLFGGRTVYKNFFNQKKHVLQFLAERIEKSFNLTREQLILLALLVGSDYTTGLTGVGPVTAMEILASFPHKKLKSAENTAENCYTQLITGLKEFKSWLRAGRRTDNISLKKKLKSVKVTDEFPSARVVQAYMEPYVDKNKEKFCWGELDITVLREYAKTKFGWNQYKLDEIIKPVLKRLQERKSQKTVHDYFKRKTDFQCLEDQMSKRVKAAVHKMGPEQLLDNAVVSSEEKAKVPSKRKPRGKKDSDSKELNNPGVSKPKKHKINETIDSEFCVKVVTQIQDNKPGVEIKIPKTGRSQEIIPQRQKDMKNLLQNKMKAIEVFRKSKIDTKHKRSKRRPNLPKDKADLSESSDGD